jgi:hypothetical protein
MPLGSKWPFDSQGNPGPGQNGDWLEVLRLKQKVQFFPIVNATSSGEGVQMQFPGCPARNPIGKLREMAVNAATTQPMAGS